MSNYNSQLQSNNTDLQAILNTINELPSAGGTQATPTITVNSSTGLITATAGTKSSTYQLAFQAAQTITPGTTNKTIAANTYLGGIQTIKGDANLVAGNIKKDTSIFGVTGTYEGSGGDTSIEDSLVTRTVVNYINDRVTSIGANAFYVCTKLTTANFPAATSIGHDAFYMCFKLTTANFPAATSIGYYAFYGCSSLTHISFPKVTTIDNHAFYNCTNLTTASFPKVTTIASSAFYYCNNLSKIYLGASTRCALLNSNAFSITGIWSNKGSIFVPASLLTSYKAATNWAFFSKRIFSYAF